MDVLLGAAGLVAGFTAALSGFGVGSFLTPVFASSVGTKVAVAAVAIPHLLGSGLRLWFLRRDLDRQLLRTFGLASAAGGLVGAALYLGLRSPALTVVFGSLLVLAGLLGLTGLDRRVRISGSLAWIGGLVAGLLGGVVGHQGGIRSAALLGAGVDRKAFVATSTAVAVIVDAVRTPVYLIQEGPRLVLLAFPISIAIVTVALGTILGLGILSRMPERLFRAVVSALILLLGIYVLIRL
ncbi:MAG: TSUP family transporter [Actinomycetota bacterium]